MNSIRKYRKSITGVRMLEADHRVEIALNTLCPTKWVIVDTEPGHIYGKGNERDCWVMPSMSRLQDARLVIDGKIRYDRNK